MAPKNKRSASNVTYNVTEEQMENMIRKASEAGIKAGIEAYKTEYKETARRKVDRMLYKTKVLLEKYRYLTEYADQSVYTLKKAEEVNENIADIEALTKFGIFDDDKT